MVSQIQINYVLLYRILFKRNGYSQNAVRQTSSSDFCDTLIYLLKEEVINSIHTSSCHIHTRTHNKIITCINVLTGPANLHKYTKASANIKIIIFSRFLLFLVIFSVKAVTINFT